MYFPHGETVTLLKEKRDRLGDMTLVEDVIVKGCAWSNEVQGVTGTGEIDYLHTQVASARTLFLPPDSGISATHRVRFSDGTTWEVVGATSAAIGRQRSPFTGWYPGDQAALRRVTG